jgi:hypothetical protein
VNEEEEEIILHLCHDRKKATHKTKKQQNLLSVLSSHPSLSLSFFLSLSAKKPKLSTLFFVNSFESKYCKKRHQLEEHNNTTTTTTSTTTTTTRDYNIMVIT